jgi:Uncharacterized protein conserved in bacteria
MILKKITPADTLPKQNLLTKSNKKLILFFTGWGMDEQLFEDYSPRDKDLIVVYDYRNLQLNTTLLTGYQEIQVFAWSMGVWAASLVLPELQKSNYPISSCTAINGTPFPIDNEKGIPTQLFRGTLDTLSEKTLEKFRLRMCGSRDLFHYFLDRAPQRNIEDLRLELIAIEKKANIKAATACQWSQVYIGKEDRIFSMENQKRAWCEIGYNIFDAPHYPEQLFRHLLK